MVFGVVRCHAKRVQPTFPSELATQPFDGLVRVGIPDLRRRCDGQRMHGGILPSMLDTVPYLNVQLRICLVKAELCRPAA